MSNESLTTTNDKKGTLERLSENRSLDVSFKIIGAVSAIVGITSAITGFINSGLISFGIVGLIGGLVFVLTSFLYYFVSLRPTIKRLTNENELLKEENDENNENISNLSRQLAASEEGHQRVDQEAARYHSKLKKYDWIISMAEDQQLKISDYIFLERGFYCYAKLDEDIPYINFGFDILNKSFYNIQFESLIKGFIECENKRLFGDKILIQGDVVIPSMNDGTLTITQRITESELPFLKKIMPFKANQFRLEHIVINFKMQNSDKLEKLEIRQPFAQEKE